MTPNKTTERWIKCFDIVASYMACRYEETKHFWVPRQSFERYKTEVVQEAASEAEAYGFYSGLRRMDNAMRLIEVIELERLRL